MRYLLLAGATFIVGYIAGVLFGYRSAVVDYVENDAQTIQQMANSMYESQESEEVPPGIEEAIEEAENVNQSSDSDDGPNAFQ